MATVAGNLLRRQLLQRPAASVFSRFATVQATGPVAVDRSPTFVFQRFFSTSGDDKAPQADKATEKAPAVEADNSPYDVAELMRSFQDTSYFDQVEIPDLSHMSNDELKNNLTIPGWELIHSPPKDKESIPRGALVGKVVSTKMSKTVNVAVDRYRVHPKYRKRLRFTKKFMAHDEAEVANMGDLVMIVPCQRISKHKHFMLREIIRAKGQL
eukprot:Nitzschia sp. Nitz4//scaffold173_size47512//36626//37261//NITZ4_007165-RA/size47512-processed-gene-0.40-mRNA-1//-1//CDS//3329538823//8765//frame0